MATAKKKAKPQVFADEFGEEDTPVTRKSIVAEYRKYPRFCLGPLKEGAQTKITKLLEEGKNLEASNLHKVSRPGCGYDLTQLYETEDFDGQMHGASCPNCKREVRWGAPLVESEV